MSRRRQPDLPAHGRGKAIPLAPRRIEEALGEFRSLNTREAQAAFADHFIGVWAEDSDYAWPMVYELLRIVEEDQLYTDPRRVGPGAPGDMHGEQVSYPSFKAYFEDRIGRPFETWAELEHTYQYAHRYAPELFDRSYEVAKRAAAHEGNVKDGRYKSPDNDASHLNNIKLQGVTEGNKVGTHAEYLVRKIAKDHPDILARMKDGEFRSVHAAALEAGIVKRTLTIRPDDPAYTARALLKHMSAEDIDKLIELLTKRKAADGPDHAG